MSMPTPRGSHKVRRKRIGGQPRVKGRVGGRGQEEIFGFGQGPGGLVALLAILLATARLSLSASSSLASSCSPKRIDAFSRLVFTSL